MKITNQTKWNEIASTYDLLTDESKQLILSEALKLHNIEDFSLMSVGDLINITNGNVNFLQIGDIENAFEHIFVDELKKFVENFANIYSSYQPRQTADERNASKNCADCTFGENLLIFVRDFFGLPSFEMAEKIKLGEVLIAKKSTYNSIIFQRELTKIQMRKK